MNERDSQLLDYRTVANAALRLRLFIFIATIAVVGPSGYRLGNELHAAEGNASQEKKANLKPTEVLSLWPAGKMPGPARAVGEERDFTKPTDRLIAGRRIIKLGNVSVPQAHVYLPPKDKRNGSAVVVCPGGGFNILAWDLEGTEVAQWLNSLGVAAIVLKYRVPTRSIAQKWLLPVQDAQRTVSLVRQHASGWGIRSDRIGMLGFSAGGKTAAMATYVNRRMYDEMDAADKQPCRPNLAILIYPAWLVTDDGSALRDDLKIGKASPPAFLVHAFDDRIPLQNSVKLLLSLKEAGVASELHVYDGGGHGYGLRNDSQYPVTTWEQRCEDWLRRRGWLRSRN